MLNFNVKLRQLKMFIRAYNMIKKRHTRRLLSFFQINILIALFNIPYYLLLFTFYIYIYKYFQYSILLDNDSRTVETSYFNRDFYY